MNADIEINELIVLNKKFSKELDNAYFAGDIVMDQTDLLQISKKTKNNFFHHHIKNISSLLLVLAVNTAYYYYDEHGFWKHFNDLTGLAKNIYDQDHMGNIFEEVLLFKNLITKKRSGPFRYVGAILGQIGVTKRNLLTYAVIIRKMINETSALKVLEKDFKYYSNFIRNNCSNSYLRKYLLDDSGWNFTNQVFKIIHYLDKGILEIDNIPDFKGFHLDFWGNFFDYYFENDLRRLEVLNFKKPTLFYDSSSNKLYIKFFSSETKILEPNIINFNPISFKGNFAHFLNKINEFHFKYSGYYQKNNSPIEWEIPGWNIKNKSFAIFDDRKGFIDTDDLDTLPEGTYYIISQTDLLIRDIEI